MTENNAPSTKPSSSERLKKLMAEEKRMVKGIFRFHECPGGSINNVPMKKYPGERLTINMKDGEEYTVPLWVARWLNGYDASAVERNGKIDSCGYAIHQHSIDPQTGAALIQVGLVRRRMSFESNEYMTV